MYVSLEKPRHHRFNFRYMADDIVRVPIAATRSLVYLTAQTAFMPQVSSPQEWWERFHGILVGAKISREQVASVAKGADVSLREGTAEFLLLLQDLRVSRFTFFPYPTLSRSWFLIAVVFSFAP